MFGREPPAGPEAAAAEPGAGAFPAAPARGEGTGSPGLDGGAAPLVAALPLRPRGPPRAQEGGRLRVHVRRCVSRRGVVCVCHRDTVRELVERLWHCVVHHRCRWDPQRSECSTCDSFKWRRSCRVARRSRWRESRSDARLRRPEPVEHPGRRPLQRVAGPLGAEHSLRPAGSVRAPQPAAGSRSSRGPCAHGCGSGLAVRVSQDPERGTVPRHSVPARSRLTQHDEELRERGPPQSERPSVDQSVTACPRHGFAFAVHGKQRQSISIHDR